MARRFLFPGVSHDYRLVIFLVVVTAALAILLSGDDQALPHGTMQVTAPGQAAGLIDQWRTAGIILTYDLDTRTIRTSDSAAVTVGQDR